MEYGEVALKLGVGALGIVLAGGILYVVVSGSSWSDLLKEVVVGTGEGLGGGLVDLTKDVLDPEGILPQLDPQLKHQTAKRDNNKCCPRNYVPDPFKNGGCRRILYEATSVPWWAYIPGAPILPIYTPGKDAPTTTFCEKHRAAGKSDHATKHYKKSLSINK
jgi:hypothetical protein